MNKHIVSILLITCLMLVSSADSLNVYGQDNDELKIYILAVDSFEDSAGNALQRQEAADQEGLCYFGPLGSGGEDVADGGGMGGGSSPHGIQMIDQFADLIELSAWIDPTIPNHIEVVRVEVDNYETRIIAENIEATLQDLNEEVAFGPSTYVIINMSFALIPCAYYDGLGNLIDDIEKSSSFQEWEVFRQELLELYEQEFENFAPDAANFDNDPLGDVLSNPSLQGAHLISIASAGNFGFDFPTWPAAWPFVVSVSGSEIQDGLTYNQVMSLDPPQRIPYEFIADEIRLLITQASSSISGLGYFSSSGEIMMPGKWLDEGNLTIGSSYAAPRLSVLTAIYIFNIHMNATDDPTNVDICRNDEGHFSLAYSAIVAQNHMDYDNFIFGDLETDIFPLACLDFVFKP